MLPVVWAREALDDASSIADCISDDNPAAADRMTEIIFGSAEVLGQYPSMYRKGRLDGTREAVIHPNYVLVYRVEAAHTLVNHLVSHIRAGDPLQLWSHAVRCLVDVDHVAAITMHLLRGGLERDRKLDLAPPESLTLQQLLPLVEETLGQQAVYTLIDRGGGATPDSATFCIYAGPAGIDASPGYTRRLLRKYYGAGHD